MAVLKIEHLAKIEGHAGLTVRTDKNKVLDVTLDIVEGARFFEGILKGRFYYEAPVLTSRICGVCPVPHTLASIYAMESILGITVSEQTKVLRELMLIGEMLESHSLHLYFFALPDYLGYESAIAMVPKYGDEIKRALRIKKTGNELTATIAGREVHPISSVIGGFSKLPKNLNGLKQKMQSILEDAEKTVRLFEALDYPDFTREVEYVALKEEGKFAYMSGNIASTKGLNIPPSKYREHFTEFVKPYSTSKFSVINGKSYAVGAISRINLSMQHLMPVAKALIEKSRFKFPSASPYMNNVAQAIEMVHFIERGIELLEKLAIKEEPLPTINLRAGRGIGVIEAPRGTLFHEFEINGNGLITSVNIVTPTAQAINNIEQDIFSFVPGIIKEPKGKILLELEKLIRSYDPCISCSAHFLKVDWK